MRIKAAAIIATLAASPVTAGDAFQNHVASMVKDMKVASVETEFLEIEFFGMAPASDLQAAFEEFATSDPAYGAFIASWQAAYPNSVYANTAAARYKRVAQAGGVKVAGK